MAQKVNDFISIVQSYLNPLQVYINKSWNEVKASDISASKKQSGTFVVRLDGKSIRVSPASIRPSQSSLPFRAARYVTIYNTILNEQVPGKNKYCRLF